MSDGVIAVMALLTAAVLLMVVLNWSAGDY